MKWSVFNIDDDLIGFIETEDDASSAAALAKAQDTMPAIRVEERNEFPSKSDH